jgi:hypothetical protein
VEDDVRFGPGLRELELWAALLGTRDLTLASTARAPASRHVVFLLTDEDGQGDLSAPR